MCWPVFAGLPGRLDALLTDAQDELLAPLSPGERLALVGWAVSLGPFGVKIYLPNDPGCYRLACQTLPTRHEIPAV